MTISSSTNRSDYAGNGSTTAFDTGFKFFTNSDLTVILVTDSTGAEAVQVITTNYSVAGAGVSAGGTVTMVVAPATGETLVMIRAQPYTQSLDLVENDGFPSDSVEETLDKTVIMTQQLLDAMGRTLRQPGGDTTAIAEMPAKVTRASAFLAFNAAGDPIASAGTDTSVPISAFMATVVDDATAAAARATLGAVIGTDVQAYDVDTSKLDVAETRSATLNFADLELIRPKIKDYGETINAIGSIGGGTQDIDLTLGNVVSGTVDTSTTTFTFSNPSPTGVSCSFTLILTNGGSQTINWPASVDWPAATAPTLTASGVDVLTFFTLDAGTIWYGFLSGKGMA